jgi:hypothetical protein
VEGCNTIEPTRCGADRGDDHARDGGMPELLPGATSIVPLHRSKENVGTVSYAGSLGDNVAMNVDGADNRDHHFSGHGHNLFLVRKGTSLSC